MKFLKFFGVSVTVDPRITGTRDGLPYIDLQNATIEKLQFWDDYKRTFPADGVSFPRFMPEEDFVLEATLPAKARLMDFMNYSPYLLPTRHIISQKAADFLTQHSLLNYELIPLTLYQKKTLLDGQWYFWANHKILPEVMDLSQSIMTWEKRPREFSTFKFQHLEEYYSHMDKLGLGSKFTTIKLLTPVPPPDCFEMKVEAVFMSQACWEDYERSGLIGLEKNKREIEWME